MVNMKTRTATLEDVHAVLECFQTLNINGIDYFNLNIVTKLIQRGGLHVAEEGGSIYGAMAVDWDEPFGNLQIFALGCRIKGKGAGTTLIREAEEIARDFQFKAVFAESYVFYNTSTFYENLGFKQIKEWHDGFSLGRIFQKTLTNRAVEFCSVIDK